MIQRTLFLVLLFAGLMVSAGVLVVSSNTSPSTNGVYFDHVLTILMENQPINSTYNCGSLCVPFLTPFANGNGLATNFVRVQDGSLPNYFALSMGQINQNPFPGADCSPHPGDTRTFPNGTVISNYCPQSSVNIVDRLERAGLTWKDYQENYPGSGSGSSYYSSGGCYLGYSHYTIGNEDATYYAADHNPFVYYSDIVNSTSRCSRIVAANSQRVSNPLNDDILVSDLNSVNAPNYLWLTPDECDMMHHSCYPYSSTDNTGAIQQGSNYLSQLIPQVLNSYTFQHTRSALVLTFDENCAVANPPGCGPSNNVYPGNVYPIETVWASYNSLVTKGGFRSNTNYNHYSLLKTIAYNWNLASFTSNDAAANPMLEFFNPPPPSPDLTLTASPTNVSVTSGFTGVSTINVSPVNGFAGTVTLSISTNSSNLGCSFSSTTITGGSGTTTLSCTSNIGGNYLATVTGTSGSLSRHATVNYLVSYPKLDVPAHVVVIVLENQPLNAVYGSGCSSSDCGYITQLASTYGIGLSYSSVAHYSLPNYLTLTGGGNYSYQPFVDNCMPSTCPIGGTNLVDTIEQSGRTWKAYIEDYTGAGCTGVGDSFYAPDHNPFPYYTDISSNSTRCANIVNANPGGSGYLSMPSTLLNDLNGASPPNLMWLSPNQCNDGEVYGTSTCTVADAVLEQNNYLQQLVPQILNSNTFKNQPSTLFITWDEGPQSGTPCPAPGQTFPTCIDPVAAIWAGPAARQGYQSSASYSHYSFVTTLESLWNLTPLPIPASVRAPPMLDFFAPASPPIITGSIGGGGHALRT